MNHPPTDNKYSKGNPMKATTSKLRLILSTILGPFSREANHAPASCNNIRALLLHLCDHDQEACQWVMRWLAYPLRHPGAKMDIGVVVNGEAGTGKTLFFEDVAAELYEGDGARVLPVRQLHDAFTRWAFGTRLLVVDGMFSKKNVTRLKQLISTPHLRLAEKGKTERVIDNATNFVFLSTSTEFLPVLESDRRLFVLEAPPRQSDTFYRAVAHEIRNGGVDAFRHYLLHGLDMAGFDPSTRPPADPAQRALREVA
jgi:hypothetical protein